MRFPFFSEEKLDWKGMLVVFCGMLCSSSSFFCFAFSVVCLPPCSTLSCVFVGTLEVLTDLWKKFPSDLHREREIDHCKWHKAVSEKRTIRRHTLATQHTYRMPIHNTHRQIIELSHEEKRKSTQVPEKMLGCCCFWFGLTKKENISSVPYAGFPMPFLLMRCHLQKVQLVFLHSYLLQRCMYT